jgi:hypothetical protein
MLMFVSIFSEGPDGKIVHVVDPTEVADVVAWLEEQGHHTIRLARSSEECEALLDEWQAETEENGTHASDAEQAFDIVQKALAHNAPAA